jgi:selenoprotein W-related protein
LLTLKQSIGTLTLVPSRGGVFEIEVNGQPVYSKLQTGRFPEPEDVLRLIRAKL